jgi:hypothetical protein
MSKDDLKHLDGFESYDDAVEGGDAQQTSGGVIKGMLLKFTNEAVWVTREGQELCPDLELVAVDIARVVQRWKDQEPVETIILEPGQKFPDIEHLNAGVPQSEWVKGPDGTLRGPYQAQHIVYLLDPATMDRYCFPTGTAGGHICVRDLADRTRWMRRFRGAHVYPVVTLSDTFMKTRYGGRQRPHFLIKRFIQLGGEALPTAPASPKLPAPSTKEALDQPETPQNERKAQDMGQPSGVRIVEPPSLKEELDDEIPI